MTRILNAKERQALDRMTIEHEKFHIKAKLGAVSAPRPSKDYVPSALLRLVNQNGTMARSVGA